MKTSTVVWSHLGQPISPPTRILGRRTKAAILANSSFGVITASEISFRLVTLALSQNVSEFLSVLCVKPLLFPFCHDG